VPAYDTQAACEAYAIRLREGLVDAPPGLVFCYAIDPAHSSGTPTGKWPEEWLKHIKGVLDIERLLGSR
jgi:hypothetical protein